MSCCQYVSLQQLVIMIERLRGNALDAAERAEHERFFLKCVPTPEALALVLDPAHHPANPRPGSVPSAEELARIVVAMPRA
ncbi:MAG: hypothetical protein ACLGHJ_07010 [Gammaproteobacteria bacterium]